MYIVSQPFALLFLGYRTVELTGNIVKSVKNKFYEQCSTHTLTYLRTALFWVIPPHNNRDNRSSQLLHSGSLQSRAILTFFNQWKTFFMVNS